MATKSQNPVLQPKIDDFIAKVPDELQIVFGPQHRGIKPDLSCSLIVENALRIYLKKYDPLQNTARWGLGKLFGRSKEKHNFPKRFIKTIDNVNKIRVNKVVHWGDDTVALTLSDMQIFLIEFLNWFFSTVANQPVPKSISDIITISKSKTSSSEKRPEKTPAFRKRAVKIAKGADSVATKIIDLNPSTGKPKDRDSSTHKVLKAPYRLQMHIEDSGKFKRDYYETKNLSLNDFRGSISKSLIYDLDLSFEFNNHDITLINRGKITPIHLNGKKITQRMKPKLSLGSHMLSIGEFDYIISIFNF